MIIKRYLIFEEASLEDSETELSIYATFEELLTMNTNFIISLLKNRYRNFYKYLNKGEGI